MKPWHSCQFAGPLPSILVNMDLNEKPRGDSQSGGRLTRHTGGGGAAIRPMRAYSYCNYLIFK